MAGTGPKQAKTPLELLTNDGTRKPPLLDGVWGYLIGGGLCLGGSLYSLYATRKPLTSGIQKTAAITIIGALIGNFLNDKKNEFYAEKDAILRHYVELHPDDFPPYQRKKYAEVLEPWVPIR